MAERALPIATSEGGSWNDPLAGRFRRKEEFELLCALSTVKPSPGCVARIRDWDLSDVEWDEFLRLAEHHGVLPLATRNLMEIQPGLPSQIERSLRLAHDANLRRSLWFSAELGRIIGHFEERGLRVVPYKGPVLAQSVYGDAALRSFSDLDFLISPADFDRAKEVLAEVGYRPGADLTPGIERLWLRVGYERSFDGAAGKNLVELQWSLLPHFYAVDFRLEDWLERAGRVAVGGCEVPCLAAEDSVLALCLHAAKHLWTRLIWTADIAESLRLPHIDYALVSARARDMGVARILGVSLWLARNVLHAELPADAEGLIAADAQVSFLGAEMAERLAHGTQYDFESTEYFRLILKLRERRGDRWRYLWRLVWTPGAGDVAAVRMPEGLFPLYRVVRIGRLIGKCF